MHRDLFALMLLPTVACVAPAYAVDYFTAAEARESLFPDATSFASHELTLTPAQRKQIRALSGVTQRTEKQSVWRAQRDDEFLGWFIMDNVRGKHADITYGAALSPSGTVIGVEIMSYRETYGGQVRAAAWRKHFIGKSLKDPFKLDEDIPNITSATLSSRNVMNGVKRLLALQQVVLSDA
ncbi:MAG: FMN-binding protein [Verrucomicrobia bacterium]|nr:FMN-binding protein [Verrucomicrobiota bacterium]